MTAEQLRNSILQEAISGRLVPQDPNDEPASALLARIREEKARLIKEGKLKKEKPSAPITDDEKPFEIPASWEWVRIANICSIVNGFTPRRTEPRFWTNGTINWFTVEDINKQGEIIRYTEQKITQEATSNDRIVRPGSVLLCCTASVGKCAITEVPVTTNQQFNALTVKEEYRIAVSDTYVLTLAKTLAPTLHQLAGQTTFEFVSVSKVGNIVVPLPPLAEQKRIVAKLEELLPIVEQYGKAQTELDELNAALPARLRQSVLQQAIQGKLVPQDPNEGTAEELLKRIEAEKARLIKEGKLKKEKPSAPIAEDEIPFEIPNTWKWVRISALYQTSSGGTPEKGHPEYYGGSIPWVKVGDLRNIYIDKTDDTISEAGLNNSSAKLFPEDTILVAMYCNDAIGKSSILKVPMTTNQAICGLYPNPLIYKEYVYYAIQASKDKLQEHAAGGAQKNINQKIVNDLVLPLPPLAEQQRIVAKIEELFEQIDKISK